MESILPDYEIKDVIENIFTEKYDRKTKLEILAYADKANLLRELLITYHPEYYDTSWSSIKYFALAKDAGLFELDNLQNDEEE